jgi:hypothetical protein
MRFLALVNGAIKRIFELREGASDERFYPNRRLPSDYGSLSNRDVLDRKFSKEKRKKPVK